MNNQQSDRIESGSINVPEVLRTLAGVLPQFEGENLEGQLQTFDTFLAILAPATHPEVARLLTAAAAQAKTAATRERIQAAAESVTRGGRAAAPYNHAAAMQAYQEEFRRSNPEPSAEPGDEAGTEEASDGPDDSDPGDADSFRQKAKRRAIVMEIGGFRPPENPQASWFGRVAFGLPGEGWPVTGDSQPMIPLAQINLTEFPFRPPRLEDIEFLAVFVDPKNRYEDETGWRVRAYPRLDALVPLQMPLGLKPEIKALPMRPRIAEEDYPCHDEVAEILPANLADNYEDEFENVSGFKLGGWPSLIQSRIEWPFSAGAAQPEHVFQIDSTEKGRWSWGDGGVGYFGRGTAPGHEDEWFLVWQCF
ncbi:MAG TPA: DUF1963 domain-containing protein [Candidatus Methylacidiphilales bacterium]|nr:DUF1963 domain-containing protein [Candidatus Methylacidiphilales bacterium]